MASSAAAPSTEVSTSPTSSSALAMKARLSVIQPVVSPNEEEYRKEIDEHKKAIDELRKAVVSKRVISCRLTEPVAVVKSKIEG